MADSSLDQRIMEKLRHLDDAAKRRVLDFIEQAADDREEAWEEQVVNETLGNALLPDGSIDFDRLRAAGITMTPEELYPEGDEDDGPDSSSYSRVKQTCSVPLSQATSERQ